MKDPPPSAVSLPKEASTVLPIETPAAAEPLYPEGQLRTCETQNHTMWFSTVLNTSQGYYELVVQDDNPEDNENEVHTWMRRIDYATRQSSPLCSREGCAHNGEDCPAWLPLHYADYSLIDAGGRLVLVDIGRYWEVSDEETGEFTGESIYEPAIIYTMDYDGQNRTKLVRMEDGQTMSFSRWATDDSYLYGVCNQRTSAWDDGINALIRIDLISGEMTELCEMDPSSEYIAGTLDGKLLTVGSVPSAEERETWSEEEFFDSRQAYFSVDTESGPKVRLPGDFPSVGI